MIGQLGQLGRHAPRLVVLVRRQNSDLAAIRRLCMVDITVRVTLRTPRVVIFYLVQVSTNAAKC